MEKRRRARINKCLVELKVLLLNSLKRDPATTSKLEKADILEMTVNLLKSLQRQQLACAATLNPGVLDKFSEGWAECAKQVAHYANAVEGFDNSLRARLFQHMTRCHADIQVTKHNMQRTHVRPPPGFAPLFAPPGQIPVPPRFPSNPGVLDPLARLHPSFAVWCLNSSEKISHVDNDIDISPPAAKSPTKTEDSSGQTQVDLQDIEVNDDKNSDDESDSDPSDSEDDGMGPEEVLTPERMSKQNQQKKESKKTENRVWRPW